MLHYFLLHWFSCSSFFPYQFSLQLFSQLLPLFIPHHNAYTLLFSVHLYLPLVTHATFLLPSPISQLSHMFKTKSSYPSPCSYCLSLGFLQAYIWTKCSTCALLCLLLASCFLGLLFDPENGAVCSSKTSVNFRWATWCNIPEHSTLHMRMVLSDS